jgi:hypothetical protein
MFAMIETFLKAVLRAIDPAETVVIITRRVHPGASEVACAGRKESSMYLRNTTPRRPFELEDQSLGGAR